MRHRSLSVSVALGVVFCGGLSLWAEPVPNRRVLVLQAPPVVSVNSVAVSPDGALIATAADGVRLYDARTGALLRAIGDAGDRAVAFSPDGRTLAAAGFHLQNAFSTPLLPLPIYDVQTGKRVQTLAGHTEWETYAIAFSPDGKLFASTGADKQILVWELATGKLRGRAPLWLAGPRLRRHRVELTVNGGRTLTGPGYAVLGDPLNVVAWLANELPRFGRRLRGGDRVTTGVTTDIYLAQPETGLPPPSAPWAVSGWTSTR